MKDRLIQLARNLRRNQTDAEYQLWMALCARQLADYKFRRQHKIGPYIADFACTAYQVIIELDGDHHAFSRMDASRTAALQSWGWRVLRFWNTDIYENIEGVCEMVLLALEERKKEKAAANSL